jgi:diguanylate cyclase (GGDEF)-like protein
MSAKIALIVSLPVIVVNSFFAFHNYVHERDVFFQNSQTQLLRISEDLKRPVESALQEKETDRLQQIIDERSGERDIESIMLLKKNGQMSACNKKTWIGKELSELARAGMSAETIVAINKALGGGYSEYYDPQDEQYCLVMPVGTGRENAGALFLSLNSRSINAEIKKRALENFGIAGIVSVLIGVSIYFLFHSLFTKRIKSISSAAVRLATGDMTVRADEKGTDEIGYLATSFNVLADEITNWRANLEELAANRVKELTTLFDVVDTVSKSLDLDKVLPDVLVQVLGSMSAGKGAIILLDRDGKKLLLKGCRGLSEESLSQLIDKGQGCVGDVILKKSPIMVSGEDDTECAPVPGLERENIRSALVVPVTVRGEVLGVLALYGEKKNQFTDEDGALLETIGNQVGVAVENARLYEKTLELAQIDGLTKLANRRHLMERLKQEIDRAERYHTSLSLIILDLDKFKSFNDTYGHLQGDELLKAFSSMLSQQIRSADIAGRYGGEEFCVVLPNTSVKGALVIAERIRNAMTEIKIPVGNGRPPAGRTVSIGVAEFTSDESVEKILNAADSALYRAKQGGRNKVAF